MEWNVDNTSFLHGCTNVYYKNTIKTLVHTTQNYLFSIALFFLSINSLFSSGGGGHVTVTK